MVYAWQMRPFYFSINELRLNRRALMSRVLDLFSKVESRISRTLLCSAAGIAASRLPLPTPSGGGGNVTLNAALRDLALFNADLAKRTPPSILESMRAV
ncbi:unnamed protein product, partial [Dibothriocephalus latus]